jgi:Flp pilus assembly protein TadB
MTALQLQLALGGLIGLGLALLVRGLVPVTPDLGAALARLTPPATSEGPGPADLSTRIGLWASARLPVLARARVPEADYAILGVNPVAHAGKRLLAAGYGLAFPALANLVLALVGAPLPWALPAILGPATAVVFLVIADGSIRDRAAEARLDFTRALVAYLDLVTLERRSGAGTAEALEAAAAAAYNPAFLRLRSTLSAARWAGTPPWDALDTLATDIALPQLDDLANIMRLAGEQSTSIADTLAARSRALRTALAEDEHAAANAAGERMWAAGALLAVIYLAMLAGPGILRVLTTT